MIVRQLATLVAITLLGSLAWIAPALAQPAAPALTVVLLPTPPPAYPEMQVNGSEANDLNDLSQVVGERSGSIRFGPPFFFDAVVWQQNRATFLPGEFDTLANAINNRGQVVGRSFEVGSGGGNEGGVAAELWQDGKATLLQPFAPINFGPYSPVADALDINNGGLIVGWSNTGEWPTTFTQHAVIWTSRHTVPIDIGRLLPRSDAPSFATTTNDRGQIFGATGLDAELNDGSLLLTSTARAVLWDNGFALSTGARGSVTELGSFAPTAANDHAQVAGMRMAPSGAEEAVLWDNGRLRFSRGNVHPVLWGQDGQPVALPTLAGDTTGVAHAINNRGQLAGSSGAHAVRWDPSF